MKRRLIDPETSAESAEDNLCRALLSMRSLAEMRDIVIDELPVTVKVQA